MRDKLIILVGVLFIGACALITFAKISSHYSTPDAPSVFTPPPLVPSATAASGSLTVVPATPASPGRTVTTWVTVTPPPASGDGQ
jgi:hypothetical protein